MRSLAIQAAIVAAIVLLLTGRAEADQCSIVPAAQAERAIQLIRRQGATITLCEPCGDRVRPGLRPVPVTSATAVSRGEGTSEVVINGQEVDLAYVYVNTIGNLFVNTARVVGCPTEGVSPRIVLSEESTAAAPIPAPSTAAASPPPAPAPPPPSTACLVAPTRAFQVQASEVSPTGATYPAGTEVRIIASGAAERGATHAYRVRVVATGAEGWTFLTRADLRRCPPTMIPRPGDLPPAR